MKSLTNGFGRAEQHRNDSRAAFTLLELMVILSTTVLLAFLALPVLANGKAGSQLAVCANNLSQIGRALAIWGTDHGDLYPWQIYSQSGGTQNHPSGQNFNIYFQFSWISNELATPKILACPSDRLVNMAQHFGGASNGFLDRNYKNNAVSYSLSHPFVEDGRLVLGADRNMNGGQVGAGGCHYFGDPFLSFRSPSSIYWGENMHVGSGNLLFNDGSVEQTDTTGLREVLGIYRQDTNDNDNESFPHFQGPRTGLLTSESEK